MLTAGEIQSIESALNALEADVVAAEAAAADARNWLAFVGLADELTTSTREAAEVHRGLLVALRQRRDAVAELADFDHEAALEIVATARRSIARNVAGNIRDQVKANAPVAIAGRVVEQTTRDAVEAGKTAATWTKWGLIPLAVTALAAWAVWKLAPLFKGSR